MFFKVLSNPTPCYEIPVKTQAKTFFIPSTLKYQLTYRNTWIWIDKISKLCRYCSQLLKTSRGTQTNNNVVFCKVCRCVCAWDVLRVSLQNVGPKHGYCREDKFVFIRIICVIEFVFLEAVGGFSPANLVGKPNGGGN